MKIISIASASLLVALVLTSCTNQNTEVKVGSSPSTSADTNVKTDSSPSTLATSKLFLFTRNGKYGYIDRTGKIVIPAKLDTPYENSNSATLVGEASQNENRDELISFEQDDISANMRYEFMYRLGLYGPKPRVRSDYLYGYKNRRTGKVIVRPQFRNAADRFSEGLAWVIDKRDRVGYIDKQGKVVILPQYSYSEPIFSMSLPTDYRGSDFNGGLARVCSAGKSSKCGYIDRTGKVVIPLKYDRVAEKFSNGLAWVEINEGYGYIDKTGKIVISLQSYSSADNFDGDLARVCRDKCGYIDRTGKVVIPLKYDRVARKFSNGLAWVVINERLGYIDKTGQVKIPIKFTYDFQPSRPRYFEDGPFVAITGTGLDVNFERGLAVVRIPKTCGSSDGKDCDRFGYGYIDTTGKLVFEF
ncbi:WG repeat-containing protein [Chamaesiphon sp. VAR_48_metabat_403]|uniref:WG repeat-containing protein n=1 Tax=Chamaesiphon sp. VAR_48_metabat_403 TaxID=2964700 RepID=UPI00286E71D2|nr:WG repeat-containing protein [Chamaesiphon sp. VAR_48_metabat_403]